MISIATGKGGKEQVWLNVTVTSNSQQIFSEGVLVLGTGI